MPHGGELVIKTANLNLAEPLLTTDVSLAAGRYVALAVSDTGIGMEEEIRPRIFEPFFTTKGPSRRHRTRSLDRLRDRRGEQGAHPGRKRAGPGLDLHDLSPAIGQLDAQHRAPRPGHETGLDE